MMVLAICSREPPIPSEHGKVPAGFDRWFARTCARAPDARWPSAREAAADLRRLCEAPSDATTPGRAAALAPTLLPTTAKILEGAPPAPADCRGDRRRADRRRCGGRLHPEPRPHDTGTGHRHISPPFPSGGPGAGPGAARRRTARRTPTRGRAETRARGRGARAGRHADLRGGHARAETDAFAPATRHKARARAVPPRRSTKASGPRRQPGVLVASEPQCAGHHRSANVDVVVDVVVDLDSWTWT